jgi:uncharacterized protein
MADWTDAIIDDPSGGVIMTIAVTAGSKTASFPNGYNPWRNAILLSVTAPAIGGKANKALVDLIAGVVGLPRSQVRIIGGATSGQKRVHIDGIDKRSLFQKLSGFF